MKEDCLQCIKDKIWNRVTLTNKHDKDCKQYSNYDDKVAEQRKYALTLNEIDRCLKIHSWPRPIDAKCTLCYEEYWLFQGHQCNNLVGFPLEICN